MLSFILRRLVSVVVTFVVVSMLIFLMMHAIPGGPFDAAEMPIPREILAKLEERLGLNEPIYVQYFKYMWSALQLNFGVPYQSPGETVLGLMA